MAFAHNQHLVRHPGNQALFDAVELAVLSILRRRPLHIHVEGLRGTGKTSVLRSARSFLPYIERVRGCRLNCDPGMPHCPQHRDLDATQIQDLGTEWVPMPFLEISHSAKLGTVVGSLDLSRLTNPDNPEAALLPGTLARAHRGIVLVDEINRLADTSPELTDVMLDVLGTKPGRLQIEETGLNPVALPIDISVWAASNPDEEPGPLEDIRRQLADRFDLVVNVDRPDCPEAVSTILSLSGKSNSGLTSEAANGSRTSRSRITIRSRRQWPTFPDLLRQQLGRVYVDFGLESLRALEAWQLASLLVALREDQQQVAGTHLLRTAPWALHHRVELSTLAEILRFLEETLGLDMSGSGDSDRPGTTHLDGEPEAASAGARAEMSPEKETSEEIQPGPLERMFSPLKEVWQHISGLGGATGSSRAQSGYGGSSMGDQPFEMGAAGSGRGQGYQAPVTAPARGVPGPTEPATPLVALDQRRLFWDGQP